MPFIIADLFLALGMYCLSTLFIKKKTSKIPFLIFVSVLFNPAIIYNSALWGQIDVFPLAFTVWSFYYIFKKQYLTSSLLFSLGLLSKQTLGVLLPTYGLAFLQISDRKNVVKSIFFASVVFFIFFLPFYKKGNILIFLFTTYIKIATNYGGNPLSAHAFNFWWMITNKAHVPDTTIFFGLFQAALLSKLIVGTQVILVLGILIKRKVKNYLYYLLSAAILCMGIFLFSTRMHERHLLPALPFLLLITIINPCFYWLYIIVSIIHFLNLYAAWGRPQIIWLIDTVHNKPLTNMLIIIEFIILLILYIFYIRFVFQNKQKISNNNNKRN